MKTIARFDAETRTWAKIGTLNVGNSLQNVIFDGTYFLVIGGHGKKKTEKCTLADGEMTCELLPHILDSYSYYPELCLVDQNFGE